MLLLVFKWKRKIDAECEVGISLFCCTHMYKWKKINKYEFMKSTEAEGSSDFTYLDVAVDVLLLFLYLLLLFCFVIITSVSLMESLVCCFFSLGCSCPVSFCGCIQLWKCILCVVPSLHIGYTNIFMYRQNKAQRHVIGILSEYQFFSCLLLLSTILKVLNEMGRMKEWASTNDDKMTIFVTLIISYAFCSCQ